MRTSLLACSTTPLRPKKTDPRSGALGLTGTKAEQNRRVILDDPLRCQDVLFDDTCIAGIGGAECGRAQYTVG